MTRRIRGTATQASPRALRHSAAALVAAALTGLLALLAAPAAGAGAAPAYGARLIAPLSPGGLQETFAELAGVMNAPPPSAVRRGRAPGMPSGAALARAPASATPAVPAAAGACTPKWGLFRAGSWPPGCWRPYGPASPFNMPIPASPRIDIESSAIIRYITRHGWAFEHNGGGDFTWDAGGSRPVYWPTSSDPMVSVTCRSSNCERGMKVRIPAGAAPEQQSDAHMTVVDQEHGREYDFWEASKPSGGAMAVSAGNSIAIGPETGTGLGGDAEAADLGLLGGIIRAAELSSGRIEHALVVTAKCVQERDVWPSPATAAGDTICPRKGTGPHFASLLQLNMSEAEIAATGAPVWQRAIMSAMARYGAYVVDTQNSHLMYLLAEDDVSFTSLGYPGQMSAFVRSQGSTDGTLVGVPISTAKLRVIDPCVPERKC